MWNRLKNFSKHVSKEHEHALLGEILEAYVDLLRRTNRVVLRPNEQDLAYLKKLGALSPGQDLDSLASIDELVLVKIDDEALIHIARLYELERLRLTGLPSEGGQSVTDEGLAHIKRLTSLRILSLTGRGSQAKDWPNWLV